MIVPSFQFDFKYRAEIKKNCVRFIICQSPDLSEFNPILVKYFEPFSYEMSQQ